MSEIKWAQESLNKKLWGRSISQTLAEGSAPFDSEDEARLNMLENALDQDFWVVVPIEFKDGKWVKTSRPTNAEKVVQENPQIKETTILEFRDKDGDPGIKAEIQSGNVILRFPQEIYSGGSQGIREYRDFLNRVLEILG